MLGAVANRSEGQGLIWSRRTRRAGAGASATLVVIGVAVLPELPLDGRELYRLSHSLMAAPFLVAGLAATRTALAHGPLRYRTFWRRWQLAGCAGAVATVGLAGAALTASHTLVLVSIAALAAAVPAWVAATAAMARAQAGRWSLSVDALDAVTALVVFGTPGALLFVEPIRSAADPVTTLPFALCVVLLPGAAWLSAVHLARMPAGERAPHALGLSLIGAAALNCALQVAYSPSGPGVPLRALLVVHGANMALLLLVPLWAHRRPPGDAGVDRVERPFDAMPYVGAVVLLATGTYVLVAHGGQGWVTAMFLVVTLAVVVLNAIRHAAMAREARRLSDEVARVAEDRRRLLLRLLHGLERDRQHTAVELHAHALASLAVLGSVARTAQFTLPADPAHQVKATVASLARDLSRRADELRQLMVAFRAPANGTPLATAGSGPDDVMDAALQAFVAELYRGRSTPELRVEQAASLELDWSTTTIAYRLAQEALLDAAGDTTVTSLRVSLAPADCGVTLEVEDDGHDDPDARGSRGRHAAMQRFAGLGHGAVEIVAGAGRGHLVRCHLGVVAGRGAAPTDPRPDVATAVPSSSTSRRRHLRLVPTEH